MKKFIILVVVVAVGIFAYISLVPPRGIEGDFAQCKSVQYRDTGKLADIDTINLSIRTYQEAMGTYPQSLDELVPNYLVEDTFPDPSCDSIVRHLSDYYYDVKMEIIMNLGPV